MTRTGRKPIRPCARAVATRSVTRSAVAAAVGDDAVLQGRHASLNASVNNRSQSRRAAYGSLPSRVGVMRMPARVVSRLTTDSAVAPSGGV